MLAVRRGRAPSKKALPSSIRSLVKNPLASSGTIVYRGGLSTERVDWTVGSQGTPTSTMVLMSTADIGASFVTAIGNTTAATDVSGPVIEPNFWIKKATMRITVTNACQIDCWVTFWPCVARYDHAGGATARDLFNAGALETKAYTSGSTSGDPTSYGYTPFQNRALCESYRFLKPQKKFLQGGQSVTCTFSDPRPFHLTYGHVGWLAAAGNPSFAIKDHTREVLITAQSSMVGNTDDDISPGFGTILLSFTRTYEWVQAPMPHHYNDMVGDFTVVAGPAIIQPQTGAVNTTPVSIPT